MTSARTVLLASDLTARSDRPTDRAFMLGEQLGASVLLLHVAEKDATKERFEESARDAIEAIGGHRVGAVEVQVRCGEVHREILQLADECDPLLIVTGVARFNSVRDFILGTAVDQLVRQSHTPVLVVKRRALLPYSRLLVATDFSLYSKQALETAASLFPDAVLTIWHGYHAAYEAFLDPIETAKEIRRQAEVNMAAFLRSIVLPDNVRDKLEVVFDEGELLFRASQTMRREGFDLLVLGTHGRGGLAHATIGSRAAELLQCVDHDVLMVRGAKPGAAAVDARHSVDPPAD